MTTESIVVKVTYPHPIWHVWHALTDREALATWFEGEERQQHSKLVGKNPTIVFQVDDCRSTYERLSAQGVEFSMPPTDVGYGTEADAKDLYGTPWFSYSCPPSIRAAFFSIRCPQVT